MRATRKPGALPGRLAATVACALLFVGCATPPAQTPRTAPSAAPPRADAATIQACRRDAPAHAADVQFPGAYRAFQLVRDGTATTAPTPPSTVREEWAAILCNYDLARLGGELRYLGPDTQVADRVSWRFRVTTVPAGQRQGSATYELSFATTPDGAIVSSS